jgi:putative Holliday junction resolvase
MNREHNKTFIAIDYGTRRVGLAKSDPTGLFASALVTLEVGSIKETVEAISKTIAEHRPDGLVIGYPLLDSGDKSEKCREIDRFVEKLQAVWEGPIHMVDEAYSTEEAAAVIHAHGKKTGHDKKRLDRIAAVVILQRFLDERPKEKSKD